METEPATEEPSDILKAHPYLMTSHELGYLNLKEAERQALVSEPLKEDCSSTPFYKQRADADPNYFDKLAGLQANHYATVVYKGVSIPYIEHPISGTPIKD